MGLGKTLQVRPNGCEAHVMLRDHVAFTDLGTFCLYQGKSSWFVLILP